MAHYLGVPIRNWVALAATALALSFALAISGALPSLGWECGAVWEEGQWLEASCSTEEELQHRLDSIRAERSGVRNWVEVER